MPYTGPEPARRPLSSDDITDGIISTADLADSAVTAAKVSADVAQLGKNLIINGAHQVDQRSGETRTGFGAADSFISDRWRGGANGSPSARWTVSIETSGGPATTDKWLKCLCTTADASPGSLEAWTLRQAMEAQTLQSLVTTGTLGAVTISGKAIAHADGASSITFPAKLAIGLTTSDGTARQYYTNITFAAADTWTDFEINIPADGTATINNDNGQGLNLQFGLYGGSGRVVAADATWENDGADSLASDSDNWADATNNYIGFTKVQLEAGSVATDFEHEDYDTTYQKCRRYLRAIVQDSSESQTIGTGHIYNTSRAWITWAFGGGMRDTISSLTYTGTGSDIKILHKTTLTDTTGTPAIQNSGGPNGTGVGFLMDAASGTPFTAGEGATCYIAAGANGTRILASSEI